jgi:hypothetical protein
MLWAFKLGVEMKFKNVVFIFLFLLIFNVISSLTIKADSLKYFIGKLTIIEKTDKDFSSYNSDFEIVSRNFSDIIFKPKEYDSAFRKTIPYPKIEKDRDKLEINISRYFQFPNNDEYFDKRIFILKEQNILITLMSDVWGFERIFYALCFWEIQNDKLELIQIINKPLTVGIAGINIVDCIEFEKDNFVLILNTSGGDAGDFWGNYTLYQFSLSGIEQLNQIYQVEFGGSPKEHIKIFNFNIDKTDIQNLNFTFDKIHYKSESTEEFPKDHKILSNENIKVRINDLLKK